MPARASAHAVLASSSPAAGAELQSAPDAVVLDFTEEPDAALSSFRVRNTESRKFGDTADVRGRTVGISVPDLPVGVYVVEWRVVSKVDGHLTAGTFAFGVGEAPGNVTQSEPSPPGIPPLGVAGRFLFLIGLMGILGVTWVSAAAFRELPSGAGRFAAASVFLAVAGLVMLAESQRQSASVGYRDLLSTFLGRALVFRAVGLAASALAILAAVRFHRSPRRLMLLAAAFFSSGAILAHVSAGHAGAADSFKLLKVASQWTHFSAAGVWVGGLVALVTGVRGAPTEEKARAVSRYSFVAGIALAAVVASGTFRAVNSVGSWKALVGTGYGRLVILKIALIIGLISLGAVNRYRNVPRASRSLTGLRRVSSVEISLAVIVLAATALLANLSPPTSAAISPPAGIVTMGSDFAETIRVTLEVTPGEPGINLFTLKAEDFDSGDPIAAQRVVLRFEFPGDPDVPESQLELDAAGEGLYRNRGGNLSIDGPWQVIALVQLPDQALEIPLPFATGCRAEGERVTGQPTLYDIRLQEGRSVQGYVDPGRGGASEVHFTFFDANGLETPTGATTAILATKQTEGIESLTFNKLSQGHFVAKGQLSSGLWRFDISTQDSQGTPLRACFEERISKA